MRNAIQIEDIEEARRLVGIDDVELRKDVSRLRVGDLVRLTLLTGPGPSGGTPLLVRITRINGNTFQGRVANPPASLAARLPRSPLTFTRAHIHSIPGKRPAGEA